MPDQQDGQLEEVACKPDAVRIEHFNENALIPSGVTIQHVASAMNDFVAFMRMVNVRLHEEGTDRLESMLMPANFSSIVGEFMSAGIPKRCSSVVKNRYHNGHPDIIPAGLYPGNVDFHLEVIH
ncbi:MAG: hypothetical protein ABI605_19075 [Rhizobacter sp.]